MNKFLVVLLGSLFFGIPFLIVAIVTIWNIVKTITLLPKVMQNGISRNFDYLAYKKRLNIISLIQVVLLIGLAIGLFIIFKQPPEPIKSILIFISLGVGLTFFTVGAVFRIIERKALEGK